MHRLALLLALPLLACGDDTVAADTGGPTSTGDAPGSSTATPTTGDGSTSTGPAPTTGDSPGSETAATSTGDGTSTGDTTQGIDASSSTSSTSSTSETSSSSTGDDSSTSAADSSGSSTTSETTGSTGDTDDSSTGEGDLPAPDGQCSTNDLTSFVEPMVQAEELHIVGVYQPTNNTITVTVDRADIPLTLVLSSYEPVAFKLVLAPGVLLEHVILNGYNQHTLEGQGDAMVTDLSVDLTFLEACAYYWPENPQSGCDTPGLVAGAESLTGLTLASFVGCYEGSAFTLE